jgi:hypothetical protein
MHPHNHYAPPPNGGRLSVKEFIDLVTLCFSICRCSRTTFFTVRTSALFSNRDTLNRKEHRSGFDSLSEDVAVTFHEANNIYFLTEVTTFFDMTQSIMVNIYWRVEWIFPPSSSFKRSSKRRYISTRLHWVTSQKKVIFTISTGRVPNVTFCFIFTVYFMAPPISTVCSFQWYDD